MLAISNALARAAWHANTVIHMRRGGALTKSIYVGQWLRFTAVHVDSSKTLRHRKQLPADTANFHKGDGGVVLLLGDWNSLHADETRLLSSGIEVKPGTALARHFEEVFKNYTELRQQERTFRRLARNPGEDSLFSRIDSIYTDIHPTTLARLHIGVWVRGGLARRDNPSDHRPVEGMIRERSRRPPPRLKPHVTAHHLFRKTFEDEMAVYGGVSDPDARYRATIQAARSVQKRILPISSVGADPPPQALTDTCIRVSSLLRAQGGIAQRLALCAGCQP